MGGIKRSNWPIVYLPVNAVTDAFAITASMKMGYAFRDLQYKTFIAARAIGFGEYWQIGFPHGGRIIGKEEGCLAMPVFRIEMEHLVNGYMDTSVCVTRYPFEIRDPVHDEPIPLSVPLFLLAKFAFDIGRAPLTAGLTLGYFQYKIEDYPHPPNMIDHPATGIISVVPLIHSIYKIYIDLETKRAQKMIEELGSDIVADISEFNNGALNNCISFLQGTFNMKKASEFLSKLGIFVYRLLPAMYLVLKEV